MNENYDYLKDEELEKLQKISEEKGFSMALIGRLCEVKDRGFWHRICSGKKPLPAHCRTALNNFLRKMEEE